MALPINKMKYRAVIRFLHLKGNSVITIHTELMEVYGNNSPSYGTVIRQCRRFQCDQTNLNDEERSGRPSLYEEPRITVDVEALVLEDRHITVEAIVENVKISHGSVVNILHYILNMTKISARGFRDCSHSKKKHRTEAAAKMLQLCQSNPYDLAYILFVTQENSHVRNLSLICSMSIIDMRGNDYCASKKHEL